MSGKTSLKSQKISLVEESKPVRWFGIISQLKPYALIWALNSKQNFDFKPDEYLLNKAILPKYEYLDAFHLIDFTIFINRIDAIPVFKELKQSDYLLKIEGNVSVEELALYMKKFKQIGQINGIIPLALERLRKDKKNLQLI
jgi:hypothetical protein